MKGFRSVEHVKVLFPMMNPPAYIAIEHINDKERCRKREPAKWTGLMQELDNTRDTFCRENQPKAGNLTG